MKVRIGTRGSRLALWQAHAVRDALQEAHGDDLDVEIVEVSTQGDRIVDRPLAAIGGKGLFVKEIEQGLLDEAFDIAVHSAKDLPAEMHPALTLAAVLPRANPHDALVSRHGHRLDEMPPGSRVGTSSLRRRAMILLHRPDLEVINLRGNVPTRLQKIHDGVDGLDAGVLAYAGLLRLDLEHEVTEVLPFDVMLPAIGQGVVAIQTRADDDEVIAALQAIHDEKTWTALQTERALLATIEGSCHVPAAGNAVVEDEIVRVEARVVAPDGSKVVAATDRAPLGEAVEVGHRIARWLLAQGADEIIASLNRDDELAGVPSIHGVPVIVTRSRTQASELSRLVRELGGEAIEIPTISFEALDPAPIRDAFERVSQQCFDWVLFTSANGVRYTWEALEEAPSFGTTRIGVVGDKTAAALRKRGARADLIPNKATSEGLLGALEAAGIDGRHSVLYIGAETTRGVLQDGVRELGASLTEVSVYRTRPATEEVRSMREALARRPAGWITFASSSSVKNLLAMVEPSELEPWRIACIGPITAAAVRSAGLTVDVVPADISIEGLVRALAEYQSRVSTA